TWVGAPSSRSLRTRSAWPRPGFAWERDRRSQWPTPARPSPLLRVRARSLHGSRYARPQRHIATATAKPATNWAGIRDPSTKRLNALPRHWRKPPKALAAEDPSLPRLEPQR